MALKRLNFGDSFAGLLIDHEEETPYVVATLTYDAERGLRLEVPYIHHSEVEQFKSAESWFETATPPENLTFVTKDGIISLFGCHYSGHTMNFGQGYAAGYITPDEGILASREGDAKAALAVSELQSELDGLAEWTRFRAIKHDRESNEEGRIKKVVVTAESVESLTWNQGEAEMNLTTSWSTAAESSSFQVTERVTLKSYFANSRPALDHIKEQRKVAALLKMNFGRPLYFRRHETRDDLFPDRALNGDHKGKSFQEYFGKRTFRDFSQPALTKKELGEPIFYLAQAGGEGLTHWNDHYEQWKRFINPAVSVLSRPRAALEDVVVNASMSIEAAGNLLGPATGEEVTYSRGRPTTATYAFRVINKLGLDFDGISESTVGMARAMANNYNTIKHFDRGEFPDPLETYLISHVAMISVRLLASTLVDPSRNLAQQYISDGRFDSFKDDVKRAELRVNESGNFEHI
ncbi:ApeA N-terminal domain 1-containing protein [Streptomyces sp. NPDC002516]